jgi:hypothetical protein
MFKEFWPICRKAWKLCFPTVKVKLAYVSNTPDMMMPFHEDITILPEIYGIPSANQAKMARLFLAGMQGKDVCMVNDIDLIPLGPDYTTKLMSYRKPNEFLCVETDLYNGSKDEGKFPMGYFAAEGYQMNDLFNRNGLRWKEFVMQFVGMKKFDIQEDISSGISNFDPMCFSDESLTRAMLKLYADPNLIRRVTLQMAGITGRRIDRYPKWEYNYQKLLEGYYYDTHILRPYSQHKVEVDKIMKFMVEKYG